MKKACHGESCISKQKSKEKQTNEGASKLVKVERIVTVPETAVLLHDDTNTFETSLCLFRPVQKNKYTHTLLRKFYFV